MKTKLPEKSHKSAIDIFRIRDIIVDNFKDKIAGVILFGSFARGDWQYDKFEEDRIIYEFASDYDLLVITKNHKLGSGYSAVNLECAIDNKIEKYHKPLTPHDASVIVESHDRVNKELERGQYFFSDIKKEGVLLYAAEDFELKEKKKNLTNAEIKELSLEYYDYWFPRGVGFLKGVKFYMQEVELGIAAFTLHQSAESLLNCSLLVLTGYKTKTHDLQKLLQLCASQRNEFVFIFPKTTKKEKDCFKLLQEAYIGARYDKNYKITEEQLEYLIEKVTNLREITEKICNERIKSLN